jgi:sarcosine oxidase subunit gamma
VADGANTRAVDADERKRRDDDAAGVTLADVELASVWNLRGNAADPAFAARAARLFGLRVQSEAMTSVRVDERTLLWLGPRSWLFVAASAVGDADFDTARSAIHDANGALFDVSASYVAWTVSGARAARVVNRLCPLDLHRRSFVPGRCAQTLLGHIGALVYRPGESPEFIVMVARSLAAGAWHSLCTASQSEGYRVAARRPFHAVAR